MKNRYTVWNDQGVCFCVIYAKNYKSALKQANRNGYYLRNGFKLRNENGNAGDY